MNEKYKASSHKDDMTRVGAAAAAHMFRERKEHRTGALV